MSQNEPYPQLRQNIKWTLWQGDLRKICMGNHWGKNFDRSYLSKKKEDIEF